MKVKTITCHDVYNVGASLQAYALATYLKKLGNDVEIINYKPDYLSRHYSLFGTVNEVYDKPFLKQAYHLAKLPGRMKARKTRRKEQYDLFTQNYLPVTKVRYESNEQLKSSPPPADVYLAGSDQIWNPVFQNGKDPAFYLNFAPAGSVRASYAASFATDSVPEEYKERITNWLRDLDAIAVREASGVTLVESLGVEGAIQVLDPVFLLDGADWKELEQPLQWDDKFMLVYDFDGNDEVKSHALRLAKQNDWKIYSIFANDYADRVFDQEGPQTFLSLVDKAQYIISNSFHATAFSAIFEKQFCVYNRKENINTRMRDLVQMMGIGNYLIDRDTPLAPIDYEKVRENLGASIKRSKEYLDRVLAMHEEKENNA
ncbi:MAG: polysaccharide pyruvyl transferase family protein [Eubacterium sp.]|nr:polysaccharide pyruvyl transferase family protein [Eubacterium sp.]